MLKRSAPSLLIPFLISSRYPSIALMLVNLSFNFMMFAFVVFFNGRTLIKVSKKFK